MSTTIYLKSVKECKCGKTYISVPIDAKIQLIDGQVVAYYWDCRCPEMDGSTFCVSVKKTIQPNQEAA